MKILIIGRKRNGKSELAKALVRHLDDAVSVGTSEYLIYRLALIHGITEEAIYNLKERYRPELIKLGNDMCDTDPGCLVSIALWGVDSKHVIVDGVRRTCEYEVVRPWFDLVIWVDRPDIDDREDNCELNMSHADHVVSNTGNLTDLNNLAAMMVEGLT